MRIWISGAAGFIGGATVRALCARGDDVVAVVRDPGRAQSLAGSGVRLVAGDLSSADELHASLKGCDAAVHVAGSYRVGLQAAERPAMYEANVGATERVLDAAVAAGVPRIVHVSTINALGNTRGRIPDETFQRDIRDGFVSYYDETKYLAHRAAEERIRAGAPILIAMPGAVYGRGDHSEVGAILERAFRGRLAVLAAPDLGIAPIHVDDEAAGILAVVDRGTTGSKYLLGGDPMRLRDAVAIAAQAGGHRPPRIAVPPPILRAVGRVAGALGQAALAERVKASVGVTYWADSSNAARELGIEPRDLASGLRDAFGAG